MDSNQFIIGAYEKLDFAAVEIVLVEFSSKFSTQLLNSKPLLDSAVHFVSNPILMYWFVATFSLLHFIWPAF